MNRSNLSRKLAAIICLSCWLILGLQTQAQAKEVDAVVIVDEMEVRDSSGKVLGYLKKGTKVTVHSISGKIARITYKNKKGLAKLSDMEKVKTNDTPAPSRNASPTKTPKPAATPAPTKAARPTATPKPTLNATPKPTGKSDTIMINGTKAYSKANTGSSVFGTLDAGDNVQVIDTRGNWVKIKTHGKTCFVKKESFIAPTVSLTPTPTKKPTPTQSATAQPTQKPTSTPAPTKKPDSANTSKADKVISAAKAHLGKPYVYGSSGPNSFDCSGLTCYAYSLVGVYLPRTAYQQGYGAAQKLSKSQLQRGDLVFFDTIADSDLCDHVGIYLGNNQFIHASSGSRKVVISSITGYYATKFSWGRRVL